MYQVKKRNGELEIFELGKVKSAIKRTFESCHRNYQDSIVETLAIKAIANAETKIKESILNVEDIQDSVENILMGYGYEDVAKSYIVYRKQHEKARKAKETVLDYKKTIEGYTKAEDWRVKENSSINYSLGGLILGNSGAMTANYWLSEIYDDEIANAHRNCDFHIHDLSMLSGYCFTGDTKIGIISEDKREINYTTFEELVKLGQREFNILAHTGNEDEFVITKAENPRITRYTKNLIELTIRTVYGDIKIKSTEDHPYMIEDYTYTSAKELKVGQYLVGTLSECLSNSAIVSDYMSEYCPEIIGIKYLEFENEIPVYDLTVPIYHNFAVEGNIFVHNCAGWSLKTLIKEGFGGVSKKISSKPAKHLSTLCNQMVNYLGCLQNEWAGAQAFNSVDTLLAPFVKLEDLSYKEVKQCIQSLIYHLNTSSRWGCVPYNTEVLTVDGFKKYDELKIGDLIYTWHDGTLEINDVKNVLVKEYTGKIHSYLCRGYNQTVTPEHHVLCKKFNKNEYILKDSKDIFDVKTPYSLPVKFSSSSLDSSDLTDAQIQLAAIVYADGSFDFRNGNIHKISIFKSEKRFGNDLIKYCADELCLEYSIKSSRKGFSDKLNIYTFYGDSARYLLDLVGCKTKVHERFLQMGKDQSELFLDTWMKFDGDTERYMIQYDTDDIKDALQHIALRSGKCSYIVSTHKKSNKNPTNYVSIRRFDTVCPTDRIESDYSGIVWCPSVENGTAVFRKDGKIFISGQSQPVFSNFTLDWTVPDDLAELNCIVGGEEQDFKYKDCKREMDMINRAFMEVMIEGDADGRCFSYPIPTYSITKDFDWDENIPNNKLLFEMTAKYGIPYFSNYINSDLSPDSVRAMCCRLRLDLRELRRKSGGYFGSGDNTGCYDDKTEILTSNRGWVKFEELSMSDLLYTRTEDGKLEIHNPSKLFKYRYDGDIIHFNNDRFDMLVTPNHNMAYIDKHTGIQKTVRADEYKHTIHGIPRKSVNTTRGVDFFTLPEIKTEWIQNNGKHTIIDKPMQINMNDFLQFLGLFISEGSTDNEDCAKSHGYRVFITQSKSFGRLYIKDVLDRLPFNYNTYDDKFIITNKQLWTYLRENVGTSSYTVRVPRYFLNNCSSHQLFILLDAMIVGDGSVNKNNGQITYYSVSKGLIDDVQELSMLCGFAICGIRERVREDRSSINGRKIGSKVGFKCYEIAISDGNAFYVKPDKITKEDYHGYVYCCEVDNHVIMVRRNGKATWCGNSVGVVTINMPRLAYTSKTIEEFYNKLDKLMELAARSLETKRKVITQYLETGLYPYTKRYLKTFNDHFSTIGLVGMNEACLNANWLQCTIDKDNAKEFTKDVLDFMLKKCSDLQERYGNLYNLEASPSEGVMHRFALHDKKDFHDIITAGDKTDGSPYYTNSSHLPVGYTDDIFEALDHQDELQIKYTSGTVFHAFLGEKLPDWKSAMLLTRKIAENYRLPYFTFSPTYSICPEHGYIKGEEWTCPECGKQTEVYSRVTGYYRAVQNFNDGKAHEFKDRKEYVIKEEQLFASEEDTFECESCRTDFTELPEPENKEDMDTEKAVRKILASTRKPMLFTTATCPNCKMAKKFITEAGFDCDILLAEENVDLTKMYGITSAPTLIVFEDGEPQKISNVSNIRKYLEENK